MRIKFLASILAASFCCVGCTAHKACPAESAPQEMKGECHHHEGKCGDKHCDCGEHHEAHEAEGSCDK